MNTIVIVFSILLVCLWLTFTDPVKLAFQTTKDEEYIMKKEYLDDVF